MFHPWVRSSARLFSPAQRGPQLPANQSDSPGNKHSTVSALTRQGATRRVRRNAVAEEARVQHLRGLLVHAEPLQPISVPQELALQVTHPCSCTLSARPRSLTLKPCLLPPGSR